LAQRLLDVVGFTAATLATNPAGCRRRPGALSADEMRDINQVVAVDGRDSVLDTLLIRLHTEVACRRAGARRALVEPRSSSVPLADAV
jgi:hypothetical protein